MFYTLAIGLGAFVIALSNFLFDRVYTLPALLTHLLLTVLGVVAVIAVDGLFAFLIRRLPERYFAPEAKLFEVGKGEKNLYRRLKINAWKKHVPEWGCFTGFHKDRMKAPDDAAYVGRFLLESNYGVAGHLAGAVFGFLILLLPPLRTLSVALPIATINLVLSLLPTMILRYNTPALRRLYRINLERNKKVQEKETVSK